MKGRATAQSVFFCLLIVQGHAIAQKSEVPEMPPLSERITVAAGMAVSYVSAADIINFINGTPGAQERLPSYKTGIQFFGSVVLPVSQKWMVKAEYSYLIASYSIGSAYGAAGTVDFTLTSHLPCVILQYVVVDKPEYSFRIGGGAGYHFGQFSTTFFGLNETYSAAGVGAVLEVEGMTAVSENIFALLGANARWEWMGALKNSFGVEPTTTQGAVSLQMFAPSVRIGVVYAF